MNHDVRRKGCSGARLVPLAHRLAHLFAPAAICFAFAAKAATTTIPIVFLVGEDPARLGLVASLARPGRNLTGVNFFNTELAAKRLELLRELLPTFFGDRELVNGISSSLGSEE
jgi:putative tryptophan/tyrosine transport system substrate-binding protein